MNLQIAEPRSSHWQSVGVLYTSLMALLRRSHLYFVHPGKIPSIAPKGTRMPSSAAGLNAPNKRSVEVVIGSAQTGRSLTALMSQKIVLNSDVASWSTVAVSASSYLVQLDDKVRVLLSFTPN